jgi:hypothetical protein
MARRDAERFVDSIERRLAPLDRGILLADWRQTTGRSRTGSEVWQTRRHRLLTAPGVLESLRRFRSSGADGLLERRLNLLERAVVQARIEQDPSIVRLRSRLQDRIAAFRPKWHGRRVGRIVLRTVLRTHPDREERRRAFYAMEPLYTGMEDDLRSLVARRNEKAREHGFRSYPDYRLRFDRISVPEFERLLSDALRWLPEEMRRRREEFEDRTGAKGWYPWDLAYSGHALAGLPESAFPAGDMLPSVLAGVRAWGVPRSALRFRTDRHDLSAGGICLAPDPPRDVRIVVHPGRGWVEYMILFHEVGHAVHSASVRGPSHLLRSHEGLPGFGGFHEGIGAFFELIPGSAAWLERRRGLGPETVERFVAEQRRAPLRSVGFMAEWIGQELDLYLRPDRDPTVRAQRLGRELMRFDAHPPRSFADSFYVESPVYATSYLIANLLRPQLLAAAIEDVGGAVWPNRRIGPWLIDRWFRGGSAFDWRPRVREVTGRPFSARAFNAAMR